MLRWNVLAAAVLMAAVISTAAASAADEPAPAAQSPPAKSPAPVKTGKERLSSKASDEQRVDNCKVPPELRGTKPRPDACERKPGTVPAN
jgi:hypothetical protein